jgi:predicted RNA-binding Zn-ribbon protein involved in translation (DUF1610 family)
MGEAPERSSTEFDVGELDCPRCGVDQDISPCPEFGDPIRCANCGWEGIASPENFEPYNPAWNAGLTSEKSPCR